MLEECGSLHLTPLRTPYLRTLSRCCSSVPSMTLGVVSNLPRLSSLWVVIQGPTLLPTMTLPNLTRIDVEYDDDIDWLQGFRGTPLEKLESVSFCSEPDDIGDFLGAFESVVLSAQNTLSGFRFYTSSSWDPKYSSLLSFKRLKEVDIQFSCEDGCSSRVDDDIVVNLARSMPDLEALQLGDTPCATPTGITVNGFIGLAHLCPHLSKLRIHFQVTSLVEAAAGVTPLSSTNSKPAVQREGCDLTILEVGRIPFPARSGPAVAHILLQISPVYSTSSTAIRDGEPSWKLSKISTGLEPSHIARVRCNQRVFGDPK